MPHHWQKDLKSRLTPIQHAKLYNISLLSGSDVIIASMDLLSSLPLPHLLLACSLRFEY